MAQQLLRVLEFKDNFPDDQIEDEMDIIRFGGLNVATAIADMISGQGFQIEEISEEGENGWEMIARNGKQRFWLQLSSLGDVKLLQADDGSTFLSRLFRRDSGFGPFLQMVDGLLRSDGRFRELKWFPWAEYDPDGPGSEGPIIS